MTVSKASPSSSKPSRNVQRRPNPNLAIDKIVLSRRRGTGEHQYRESELREVYGDLVARTAIPEYATRQDAHSARTPIHKFAGGKSLSLQLAYTDLLSELPFKTAGATV